MTGQDPRSYLDAARRLKHYAELNKSDTQFAASHEIVYIFDTSVVEAYWRRAPTTIGGKFGIDSLLKPQVSDYSGWLSLKYLVEDYLPGMKGTAFVSPAHWNEALDRVERLESERRQALKRQSADLDADPVALDTAIRSVLLEPSSPKQMLEAATKLNLGEIFRTIMGSVSSAERIRRVFRTGRGLRRSDDEKPAPPSQASIVDLTFCSRYWRPEEHRVRQADFARWLNRITHHRTLIDAERAKHAEEDRRPSRAAASAPVTRSSNNNEHDAMTLATIQAMYRANRGAGGEAPTVRFVFVTPDAALHHAFGDLVADLEGEGIPYFLRHPHVYSPLLNHLNMSHAALEPYQTASLRQVFEGVEGALNSLFPSNDLDAATDDAHYFNFQRNIWRWSSNVEKICLSNSDYILSDISDEYGQARHIVRLLSSSDVREAAATAVSEDILEIRDDHLQKLAALAFDSVRNAKAPEGQGGHRAPVKLLDVDIPQALNLPVGPRPQPKSIWLEGFLASFRTDEEGADRGPIMAALEQGWNDPPRQSAAHLLASCIYFAVGVWESARTCVSITQHRLNTAAGRESEWMREARYCEALAIRMQLRSRNDVERAMRLLKDNLLDFTAPLARLRDQVELSTLTLTASIIQTIEDDLKANHPGGPFVDLVSRSSLPVEFERALLKLDKVLDEIENFESGEDSAVAVRVRVQAEINRLGALVFALLVGLKLTARPVGLKEIAKALSALDDSLSQYDLKPSMTARIYSGVARMLTDGGRHHRAALVSYLSSDELKATEFSRADQAEIYFFARQLGLKIDLGEAA